MAGLVPAIHVFCEASASFNVGPRVKPEDCA